MAYLITKSADINILDANGWNTVETGTGAIELSVATTINTTTSYQYNTTGFTGTNTNVCDGLLLKCYRNTTTGTVTVTLSDDGGTTATREVAVNASDLPVAESWVFFKFGSTLTLDGGTDYKVGIKGSSTGNASFKSNASNSFLRFLRLTTTATAAAGDVLYVVGEHTGAGATTSRVVTWDDTASTDFGTAAAAAKDNGLEIGDAGTVTAATGASTNYTMKCSGSINVWGGGTLSLGTTGTPIPRTSTFTLTLDCGASGDFGLICNAGSTFNAQGLSRTSGKNIYYCKLNTDEAANSTSLGVDTDTGWLDNDEIAVASTTRTASQCEAGTLNGNAGASSLTVDGFGGTGGGLLYAHEGTAPVQAEVILLTRNVKIQGASASLQGYVRFYNNQTVGTLTVDIDWVEFKWLGANLTGKRGVVFENNNNPSFSMQYCSLHDFAVASSYGFLSSSTSANEFTFSNNVTWNITNCHFIISNTTTATWTADSNIFMRNTDSGVILASLSDVGGTFTNNTMVGSTGAGLTLSETSSTIGTFSNLTSHSNTSYGINFSSSSGGTISTVTVWRNSNNGIQHTSGGGVDGTTITSATLFGNSGNSIAISYILGPLRYISATSNGDTTFATTNGFTVTSTPSSVSTLEFIDCSFSVASGIKTAHTKDLDIVQPTSGKIILNNTLLSASTEVQTQTNLGIEASISSQKHDQTAGNHKTWKKYGTITVDTTVYKTNSPSQRLTPNNASGKLTSGSFKVNVANGQTCTPTVYVRESVSGDGTDYNGNRIRLILKRNDAIGITADTVIDTATASSEGGWEGLTGTTAAATDDGVMEFIIDCDGTTGWINIDDITASVT